MKKIILSALVSIGWLAGAQNSFGQAPTLTPTARSFTLFTAIGDVTSTGATSITGDIGTDKGALTVSSPGILAGTAHNGDGVSAVAADDVQTAYNSSAVFTTGTILSDPLGNRQDLSPDTYRVGTGTTVTGDLNLDGGGDPNAVFVFKINGALTVSAAANVRLVNSTKWENVYWVVNGQVDIGSYAAFKGTIIANSAINILANARMQGRALSTGGNITLDTNAVTNTLVAQPLPVELVSFTADRRGGNALLRWATAIEKNNAYFAVQSSLDGREYTTIGKVTGHGSSSSPQTYAWTDTNLDGAAASAVYYRLAQVDADSSTHYSPVRTLATTLVGGRLQVQAYPSPSQSPCNLRIEATQAGPATLRLTDALGHLVAERQHLLVLGSNLLSLEDATRLAPGVYLVQVAQGNVRQTVRLVRE
ncbi:MAG: hypothetical protein JWP58_603 [Hymenobacter sp.]|nr:hypothetical protein [Hymenobacter sp.]